MSRTLEQECLNRGYKWAANRIEELEAENRAYKTTVWQRENRELQSRIEALLQIPIDMHDGVALTVGDTREAIEIMREALGDE